MLFISQFYFVQKNPDYFVNFFLVIRSINNLVCLFKLFKQIITFNKTKSLVFYLFYNIFFILIGQKRRKKLMPELNKCP